MSRRLGKRVYVGQKPGPFGFRNGQRRRHPVVKNAGWFNSAGELMGQGDLGIVDFYIIANALIDTESFIIINERRVQTVLHEERVGVLGLSDYCSYLIRPSRVFVLDHQMQHEDGEETQLSGSPELPFLKVLWCRPGSYRAALSGTTVSRAS